MVGNGTYGQVYKVNIMGGAYYQPVLKTSFLFLFSNNKLVIRAGIHKMLLRIVNREAPDQTASEEAV